MGLVPGVVPGTSKGSQVVMANVLNLPQGGLELIANDAQLHQDDTKFTKMMVGFFRRELIHIWYWLKDDRMELDAVDNPRKQVDSPM